MRLPTLLKSLQSFVSDDIQQDIQAMQQAYSRHDWPETERLAHKIKSSAVYLGTTRMQYACQYLERYYKAGYRILLDRLYQQLIQINDKTILAIKDWLQQ